jgi:hypothetical protein
MVGGTTLVVYWFETVAACVFVSARIVAHQRMSPRRGHVRYQAPKSSSERSQTSFVKGFLVTSLVFSAAHALFLGVILFMLDHNGQGDLAGVDWRSVKLGSLYVLIASPSTLLWICPGCAGGRFGRSSRRRIEALVESPSSTSRSFSACSSPP